MPFNHLILCYPLLLLPSIFPSIRGLFQWLSSSHQKAKVLELWLQHQSSQWISGLIFFRLTDLISLQTKGLSRVFSSTSSKASVLWCSASFIVQLSHPYMTTGKTLTRQTSVGKVMSLLFNTLSRFNTLIQCLIHCFPSKEHLLISWLQSSSTVILEPKKIKSVTVSIVSPSICHEVMGPDVMIFVFWMLSFKLTFSLSSFTFIKRLFNSSLVSAISVMSFAYLRLLIFLPTSLIPVCAQSMGEGNGKTFQHSSLENPVKSMKKKKIKYQIPKHWTLKES